MRSINRVLALTALLAMAAAGSASAAWRFEENGPRFGPSTSAPTPPAFASDELFSLAPKKWVAELRPFHPYSGFGGPSYASQCNNIKPFMRLCGQSLTTQTATRGR